MFEEQAPTPVGGLFAPGYVEVLVALYEVLDLYMLPIKHDVWG